MVPVLLIKFGHVSCLRAPNISSAPFSYINSFQFINCWPKQNICRQSNKERTDWHLCCDPPQDDVRFSI
jgi:hypothetical protein